MTSYALLMLQGGDGHWTTRNKAVTKPMRSILKRWDPNSDAYKFRIYLRNHWSHLRLLQKADEKLKWELLWQIDHLVLTDLCRPGSSGLEQLSWHHTHMRARTHTHTLRSTTEMSAVYDPSLPRASTHGVVTAWQEAWEQHHTGSKVLIFLMSWAKGITPPAIRWRNLGDVPSSWDSGCIVGRGGSFKRDCQELGYSSAKQTVRCCLNIFF